MNNLKCILIWVLWLMSSSCFADDHRCIQETTFNMRVTRAQTKIITFRKWFSGIKRKTVTYTVTDLVPRIRIQRVCCPGYTLDSVYKTCEPNCPGGCPEFSFCLKRNTCECQIGYEMRGDRCHPICEPNCDFCFKPNTCERANEDSTTTDVGFMTQSQELSTDQTTQLYSTSTMSMSTSEEPQTFSTTTELPSTEIILKDSTIGTISTSEAFTTEPQSTTEIEETTLHYLERNAICFYETSCSYAHCRRVIKDCECKKGFIRAGLQCHYDSGYEANECVEESLCTTTPSPTSTDGEYSDYNSWTDDNSDNCENECHNGLCVNGLCQCPKGLIFSPKSSGCIVKSSCDEICHNGICQEDGVCKCRKGFVYQYAKGCVPDDDDDDDCDKKCTNGVCDSLGTCRCLDGFRHNPANFYECVKNGKLSEKLEKQNQSRGFPWIWIVVTILVMGILGLVVYKRVRKFDYNVDKNEQNRHIVKFDYRDVSI